MKRHLRAALNDVVNASCVRSDVLRRWSRYAATCCWRPANLDSCSAGVPQLVDLNPTGASDPSDFVQVGDLTFFTADDGVHGRELWKTDGTLAGTSVVKDIRPGSDSSDPTDLVAFNGLLYFTADDGSTGRELWRSDGSDAGTVLVRDINPGQGYQYPVGEGNLNSFAKNTVVVGDRLMFAAEEVNTGAELWSSDGTASGTVLVKDHRHRFDHDVLRRLPELVQPSGIGGSQRRPVLYAPTTASTVASCGNPTGRPTAP